MKLQKNKWYEIFIDLNKDFINLMIMKMKKNRNKFKKIEFKLEILLNLNRFIQLTYSTSPPSQRIIQIAINK